MTEKKQPLRTVTFFEQLKTALVHYADPQWLGEQSPLAAPYFLGSALHGAPPSAHKRGLVLIDALEKTLESLWGGPLPTTGQTMLADVATEAAMQGQGDRYYCLILELNYRRRCYKPAPKNQAEIYNDILHISRPSHDRHLAQAVERLGALLLQRLRPTIRPEQPTLPMHLIGRDDLLDRLLHELQAGKAISLIGPGGMGKTSLGAAILEQWPSPATFWFTFRLTFNDQLESLLFALGRFLHEQGASTLWHQLIADGGRLKDSNLALGLVCSDLAALSQQPLLCFDEVDVLRPPAADQPNPRHLQLLELLDSLRGHTAMLLIGQRSFWESDAIYPVDGLTEPDLAALLTSLAIPHKAEDVARLHYYSGGNPRLVTLCAALYPQQSAEPFQQIIDELPQSPTLLPLWRRLARRLLAEERQLLQGLAVFRTPAPIDVWQTGATAEASALAQLLARRLLIADQQGGVALLPALREVIYDDLPVELREYYHAQAAAIRTERGEYTAAAHHLHLADQPAAAVVLWYAHRDEEINRGQAGSALALFEAISLRRLDAKAQKALLLIRGTLYQLMGEPDKVIMTLEPVAWAPQDEEQLDAALLLGKALERNGRSDAALATYGAAFQTTTKILAKSVELHFQRSMLHIHERDLQQAWQEAKRARYLAESIAGTVHEQSGDFTAARSHYTIALTIAQELNDQAQVAQTNLNLGNIAMRQQAIDAAIDHYNQAMTIQQAIGDRVAVEMARSLVVTAYMQAARYQEALPPAHAALRFFQAMGHSYWTAINASNLAEIYTELNELGEAETQALFVLEQEEPHSHPYALFTLGRVRQRQARLTEAELYLDQASTVANMNGDRFLLAYCWEELGKLHQEQAKPATALPFLRQAQSAFDQLGIGNKAAEVAARLRSLDA